MHPAFALTRTRLTETRSEFDAFLQANTERLVPLEENPEASAAWLRAVSRASGIEGVFTGMENVLKEVLNVVDGGVFGKSESFHAQLLAQAAQKTDERSEVIDRELYEKLDGLRSFRHRERTLRTVSPSLSSKRQISPITPLVRMATSAIRGNKPGKCRIANGQRPSSRPIHSETRGFTQPAASSCPSCTEIDMSEITNPASMQAPSGVDDRDEFIRHLATRYKRGLADKDYVLQGIAEFDALAVTKRMRLYSVLATFAAAVAAVSSAVTAYFAYVGVRH